MNENTSEAGNPCSLVDFFVAHSSSAVRSHVIDETCGLMEAVGLSSMLFFYCHVMQPYTVSKAKNMVGE
jgi:hypothetical protein